MKKRLQCASIHKYKIYNKLINSYTWQKLRHKKFLANPVCEMCAKEGRATPTEEVHHIVPVESGKDEAEMKRLAYDFENLQSLCRECHHKVHDHQAPITESVKGFAARFLRLEK